MHTIASPTLACIGYLSGDSRWPVVLTGPRRVYLSTTIAVAAGFGMPEQQPQSATFGDRHITIQRIAVLADDICALDLDPAVELELAFPASDAILTRIPRPAESYPSLSRPEMAQGPVDFVGYKHDFAYFARPHFTVEIGQPVFVCPTKASALHLIGFIEHIEPEYIATSRYKPKFH